TVSIVGAGICTINANQAGDANYNAAAQVSQGVTVAKANQTITFAALGGKNFGDPPFTVSATASSGLAVAFSTLTTSVCTVSGTTVTIVGSGICTVNANQAGNANYNAAPQVSQGFSTNKTNQTITFPAISNKVFGNAPFGVSATATSGLTVVFTSASPSVCTVSGATVSIVAAGICTINANQAGDANYNAAAQVSQSFTVSKG